MNTKNPDVVPGRRVEVPLAESEAMARQLRELLGVLGDWVWEQDAEFRFTRLDESFLRGVACDQSQGYYFNRPMPAEELAHLFRQQSSRPQ